MTQDFDYHRWLVSSYLYTRSLYRLSFTDRVEIDLGYLHINVQRSSEELDKLSDEELLAMEALKKPWWNGIYEKFLRNNTKRLLIIYLLFIRGDYSMETIKDLYEVLTTPNQDFQTHI